MGACRDMVKYIEALPRTIRVVRDTLDLSIRDVSAQSGVPVSALSSLERGEQIAWPSIRDLLLWLDDARVQAARVVAVRNGARPPAAS